MNKEEAIKMLALTWKELNSDTTKDKKLEILSNLEAFVKRLPFKPQLDEMSILPCDMAILEFRQGLELNPNYKESHNPSDFMYFTLAVNNSTLPD